MPEGQRAIVVGHSLGAMSIAAWAEHHQVERRVGAAALLNTGVGDLIAEHLLIPRARDRPGRSTGRCRRASRSAPDAAVPRYSTPVSQAMVRYIAFGRTATPAQIAFYERMLVDCPPDVRADVGLALSEMDLYHALPRLTVPTIVVAGADDRLTPPASRRADRRGAAERAPRARAPRDGPHGPARASARDHRGAHRARVRDLGAARRRHRIAARPAPAIGAAAIQIAARWVASRVISLAPSPEPWHSR